MKELFVTIDPPYPACVESTINACNLQASIVYLIIFAFTPYRGVGYRDLIRPELYHTLGKGSIADADDRAEKPTVLQL